MGKPLILEPVIRSNKKTITDQKYVEVLKVSIGKASRLSLIEILSSNDAKTKWKISLSHHKYEEFEATTPKRFPFPVETQMESGAKVLIEARSTDGTSITLDAHVVLGEEKK